MNFPSSLLYSERNPTLYAFDPYPYIQPEKGTTLGGPSLLVQSAIGSMPLGIGDSKGNVQNYCTQTANRTHPQGEYSGL